MFFEKRSAGSNSKHERRDHHAIIALRKVLNKALRAIMSNNISIRCWQFSLFIAALFMHEVITSVSAFMMQQTILQR